MYRVTVNDVETYLVVLRNVFSPRLTIHKKYDLKGSTVDRQASDKEKAKDLPTLKDNDFVHDGVMIHIGTTEKENFMKKLNADTEFLSSLHLMDYSLIVGIHDCEKAEQEALEAQQQAESEAENGDNADGDAEDGLEEEYISDGIANVPTPPDSPQTFVNQPFSGEVDPKIEMFAIKSGNEDKHEIYFLAMVDILTKYGMKKRTAQAAKTVKHGAGAEISTVRPDQYAKRFVEFIDRSIE